MLYRRVLHLFDRMRRVLHLDRRTYPNESGQSCERVPVDIHGSALITPGADETDMHFRMLGQYWGNTGAAREGE